MLVKQLVVRSPYSTATSRFDFLISQCKCDISCNSNNNKKNVGICKGCNWKNQVLWLLIYASFKKSIKSHMSYWYPEVNNNERVETHQRLKSVRVDCLRNIFYNWVRSEWNLKFSLNLLCYSLKKTAISLQRDNARFLNKEIVCVYLTITNWIFVPGNQIVSCFKNIFAGHPRKKIV